MNLYGIPEFLSYSILVGIAVALIRQDKSIHLKYWLVGWIVILLHAGIYMLLISGFIQDIIGRGLLALAGFAFMMAAYYQKSVVKLPRFVRQLYLIGLPNVTFAVASTAYDRLHPDGDHYGLFAVLIAAGAAGAIWQALDKAETKQQSLVLIALSCLAYGIQTWALYAYGVLMASQWQMCWMYLAVAFFFLRQTQRPTMGVIFTALSFVSWGLVFPIYSLLQVHTPILSSHIESLEWNLPKFLTAASMILVLLEEKVTRATQLAMHDALTGLPNRRLYEDRFNLALARARRNHSRFAVLIIDLNRFKQVNDTLGHQAGDQLLKTVGTRFRNALRETDLVARTGGDEFTIILEEIGVLDEAKKVVCTLQRAMKPPLVLAGTPIDVRASTGIAMYPEDGETQIELHAVADARMYDHKEQTRAAR